MQKINLKGISQILSDKELKNILGGSGGMGTCSGSSGICSGTCPTLSTGTSGTCAWSAGNFNCCTCGYVTL